MVYSSVAAVMVILVRLATDSFLQSFARNRMMRSEIKTKKTKHIHLL